MAEFVEAEDARKRACAAAADRRGVWVESAVSVLRAGGAASKAVFDAETVLAAFDAEFPEVLIWAERLNVSGADEDDE